MSPRWLLLLCTAALLLGVSPVRAQNEDAVDIDLGEIEVGAVRTELMPEEDLTADDAPDPVAAAPGTTVIPLDSAAGTNLSRILQRAPGAAVLRSGGAGQLATAQLRGARGNQVQVTLDGMPFPSFGTVDLALLPQVNSGTLAIQRSAQAGPGVGGTIDLSPAAPVQDATTQLVHDDLAVSSGSHGLLQAQWSRYGQDSQWHYTHLHAENDYTFRRGDGSTARRLNNGAQLDQLWSSWDSGNQRWNVGVGHLERGVPGSAEFPTLAARLQETAGWAYAKDEGRARLFGLTWIDSRFRDPQPYLHTGALVSHDQRWHTEYTAGALADGAGDGWGWRLRGDLADGDASGQVSRARGGIDLLHRWQAGNGTSPLTTEIGLIGSSDAGLSPTASLTAQRQLGSSWSGHASAGYSVRHPDFSELYYTDTGGVRGNRELAPERLLGAEVGLRCIGADHSVGPCLEGVGPSAGLQSEGTRWVGAGAGPCVLEAAAFWNRYYDSILFLPVSAYLVQATNTGGATVAGAELGWRAPLSSGLTWSGAATWLPIAEMDDGTPLPQRAPLRANARLDWQRPNWSASASADYAARMPADLHGNLRIPARVLVDCGVVRDFDGDELALAVTNLFDQDSRDSWNYPLPGREYNLTWRTSL